MKGTTSHSRTIMLLAAGILVVLLLLPTFGCAGEEGVTLRHEFTEGETFSYEVDIGLSGEMTGPGIDSSDEQLPENTSLSMVMNINVEEVTDGIATVTYAFDSVEMTSEGEDLPAPTRSIPDITVKMNERGEVVSIENAGSLTPQGMSPSTFALDPSQFANSTQIVLPEGGTAEVGAEWSATTIQPILGTGQEITVETNATLTSVEDAGDRSIATIDFTSSAPMDVALDLAKILKEQGLDAMIPLEEGEELVMEMTMNGSQNAEGTVQVDTGTGMPVSASTSIDTSMEMEITQAPDMLVPQEERGPFTVNLVADLNMVEVE